MSRKIKVMTIVGTRPEIIRLSRVLAVLDRETEHTLVHTGQNYDYELNGVFFRDLGIRDPDHFLNAAGGSAAETIGQVIMGADKVLDAVRPDALLILGDTNSCLAAIAAKRRKVPIFHMEAGNRCFDSRVPEETNRRIVDHTADINLPYSDIAREYLLAEGFPADRIVKTGSPMFEVLNHYRDGIEASDVLVREGLTAGDYFVVSLHREENVDDPRALKAFADTLNTVASDWSLPVVFSTHPRTRKRIEAAGVQFNELVRLAPPFGFFDYQKLQMNARAVLSDSGTISEESSILGFPALNIREAHERPEAMEEAAVMMVGLGRDRVLQGLRILESLGERKLGVVRQVTDYVMPDVSEKVLRIIVSYADYVRRVVWREYDRSDRP